MAFHYELSHIKGSMRCSLLWLFIMSSLLRIFNYGTSSSNEHTVSHIQASYSAFVFFGFSISSMTE